MPRSAGSARAGLAFGPESARWAAGPITDRTGGPPERGCVAARPVEPAAAAAKSLDNLLWEVTAWEGTAVAPSVRRSAHSCLRRKAIGVEMVPMCPRLGAN